MTQTSDRVDQLDPPASPGRTAGPAPDDLAGILLAVLRDNLSVEGVELDSKFYALGGDSLIAVRVVNDARARGVPLTLRELLARQTVRGMISSPTLLDALAATHRPAATPEAEPFSLLDVGDRHRVPEGVCDALPASALQVGMIYLCEATRDPLLYRIFEGWEVEAPFHEQSFRDALATLDRRHPALRTSFDLGGLSVPAQLVWEPTEPALTVAHAAGPEEAEALLRAWCDRHLREPVDWQSPPLARCHVVALPDSFHVVLAAHHAILDGWSFSRLAVELMSLYQAERTGRQHGLAKIPPGVQHDFITAERDTATLTAAEEHWFAQADVPPLLFDNGRHRSVPDPRERHEIPLDANLVTALNGVARMLGVPVKSIALAAHTGALGAMAGRRRDIVTGLVFNTRPESPGSDLTTGLFLNILPVRFPTLELTWTELIRAAADAEVKGTPYRAYPQARLVERLGRPGFDVTFNFMNFHDHRQLDRLTALPARGWWRRGKPSFPFHVNVEITGAEGQVRMGYDSAYVTRTSALGYADALRQYLLAVVANPVSPVVPTARGN